MKKKILKFLLKLLVSLVFLAWIVFKVEWQEVFSLLRKIEIRYIALYIFFLASGIAISAYKWKLLAKFKGIHMPFPEFFKLYLTGTFINNFMPSFVGGDAYRIYQAGKSEKKFSQSASAVVMDRLTGLFGAMILAVVFSAANFPAITDQKVLLALNAVMLISIAGAAVFFATRKNPFWRKALSLSKVEKILPGSVRKFIAEISHYSSDSRVLREAILGSMAFGIVGISLANYVIFLSLGQKISVLDYLSVIFMISFVSSIPISINNIGIKEWAYITFFGFFGVASSVVITVAILSRLLQMLFSFLAFPMYLRSKK
jgi:hypothetical protein